MDFKMMFKLATEYEPFPWQESLYNDFLNERFPSPGVIPTGLGKTAIMVIWLLALAHHARNGTTHGFPRRLVYVVNRRTVVDQATREAEQLREAITIKQELKDVAKALQSLATRASDQPLAISTLRGQFADNAEWREDPARPAIIVGTVDMIGSRLLFSGYGRGFKSRPLHAGFLGQDTLLVHDEAHLEPAFQELINGIAYEQKRCNEFRSFHVIELSATSRDSNTGFNLTDADLMKPQNEVIKRVKAKKGIEFHHIEDSDNLADEISEFALKAYKNSNQAILLYLSKVSDVLSVAGKIQKECPQNVQTLTGTMRGFERDAITKNDPIVARFMRSSTTTPQEGTVFLICTSAGEVGFNISGDNLICDLTPFDSMAQRLGRVNRFGQVDARVDVFHHVVSPNNKKIMDTKPEESKGADAQTADDMEAAPEPTDETAQSNAKKSKDISPLEQACAKTLDLLKTLPQRGDGRYDASPAALGELPLADRQAAYSPTPVILPATDILFDAWALTSIRQKLPGRPAIAEWLHGISAWELPETHVAWREEVELITGDLLNQYNPQDLLEDCPLKPLELLRDNTKRVFDNLKKLTARGGNGELPVWLVAENGSVEVYKMEALVKFGEEKLRYQTVLLPPSAGGLQTRTGMLDGKADSGGAQPFDVSCEWRDEEGEPRRQRIWDAEQPLPAMRLVRTIDIAGPDADEFENDEQPKTRRFWRWYVRPHSADDDGSRVATHEIELCEHLAMAEHFARLLVEKLELQEPEASAVIIAAKRHDDGKDREVWQRSIGNINYPERVLAKSGGRMRPRDLSDYRHELGSLIDITKDPEFNQLSPESRELALHLIAAHHGRARPYFPDDEVIDPERRTDLTNEIVRETPQHFARLQRKYGRWGLAYLESLLRAADIMASQTNDASSGSEANSHQEVR